MAALAIGMLLIIFLTGQPTPPATARPPAVATQTADSDRVRDYQERLRALDAQAALDAKAAASDKALPPSFDNDSQAAPQSDPVAADRTTSRLRELVRQQRRPQPSARNARTAARSPRTGGSATPRESAGTVDRRHRGRRRPGDVSRDGSGSRRGPRRRSRP